MIRGYHADMGHCSYFFAMLDGTRLMVFPILMTCKELRYTCPVKQGVWFSKPS